MPLFVRLALLMLLIAGLPVRDAISQAETPAFVTYREAGVFAGPGATHPQVGLLQPNVPVYVVERNNPGTWVRIQRVNDGGEVIVDGWIISGYVQGRSALDFAALPVTTLPDNLPEGSGSAAFADLYATPVLPVISDAMVDVWWLGQALGNDPNGITKVGDSLSAQVEYLEPMANPARALNVFRALAPTIDRFGPSTAGGSIAAQVGMGSFTMFDPMWADPARGCLSGEGPLMCEYRQSLPSIAFIMFGPNDVRAISPDQYALEMERLVTTSLDLGIIPVLSTFALHPNDAYFRTGIEFNRRLIALAAQYEVPLINLWAACRILPNYGLDEDNIHLTMSGNDQLYYDGGNEAFSGVALHNLLSIAVLHAIELKVDG